MKVDDVSKFQDLVRKVYLSPEYKKRRQEMNRYLRYYKGEFWKEENRAEGETEIFANYIFSTVQAVAPLLTDNRPIWYLRARKPFLQRFFQVYSDGLEYLWDKAELDMKLFRVVLDSLIMKHGLWKIHLRDGEVAIDVQDPRTFVCAPGYDDIWDAPWCGTAERKPVSWVKEYFADVKGVEEIKADDDELRARTDSEFEKMSDLEQSAEFVTVFEVWVKDAAAEKAIDGKAKPKYPNGRIVTFCQGVKLKDVPSPFRHKKPPYVQFLDYLVPHELHGMGEPDQIETLCLEFNLGLKKLAQYVIDYVDPDWYIDSACGVDPEKWKEERKGGKNVWAVNTGSQIPQVGVMPPINTTVIDFLNSIPKLIEEITQVTAVSKGMEVKKQRQTAGEIATLIESSYTRTRQRVRNLEASIKRALYLVVDIMQQFYDDERPYTLVEDGDVSFGAVSNRAEFAKRVMTPREPEKRGWFSKLVPQGELKQEYQQELEDYQALVDYLGDADQVYVDFDLEIQTNSTLPMDRQSLANLMLRLFELKAVDAEALLEILRVPKREEIVGRLTAQMQAQAQPQQAPPQEMQEGIPNG